MENQHRSINGYRELNQEEIDLMNRIKAHGEQTKALIDELEYLRNAGQWPQKEAALSPDQYLESTRAISIAKEHLQTGQMWLVRSVALPNGF
ncbi:phage protein [Vibrio maritimus]|uniref:Phage protein n=1 Tax=Vibrio maritimus TaxID=990268 RepID=A0A090S627_9VIBR|nr:phage protein [Vibrio maritimus]